MRLSILQNTDSNEIKSFIDFWSDLYFYEEEILYLDRITKTQFDYDDIQKFFTWKNGMPLSNPKQNSLDKKIKSKLEIINSYKSSNDWTISDFQKNFNDLTAVWKIFLLHIIQPNKYPIYDQHIHRAYNFIHGLDYKIISSSTVTDREKEIFYFETYCKFVAELKINLRTVDKALFSFGQFIRTNGNAKLVDKNGA